MEAPCVRAAAFAAAGRRAGGRPRVHAGEKTMEARKRDRPRSGSDALPPPPKRSAPTVGGLQRELQMERERHRRSLESAEQLRLEVQMLGRLLASSREQITALGGTSLQPDASVRAPVGAPATASGRPCRSRSDGKAIRRLQADLMETRSQCKRLSEEVGDLQQRLDLAMAAKKEIAACVAEMQEYSNHALALEAVPM